MSLAYQDVLADNPTPAEIASGDLWVSIVIPMRNEERFIGKCLDSILANDFPADAYEVLVVDGSSNDKSREIVQAKLSASPAIRLLHNRRQTTPIGLNIGIQQARGSYIIRMDAHADYPPDYIRNCVAELERTGAENVGGTLITKPGADTLVARGIALMTQSSAGVGNSAYRIGAADRYVDTVPFGAFRRTLFADIGLFREDLDRSQDFEMNARIRQAGGRIYLSPIIRSTYYNVPTYARFMKQGWRNGLWVSRTWLRYPTTFCWRHAAPLALVTAGFLPLLLSLAYRKAAWGSGLVLGMYLCVLASSALRIVFSTNRRLMTVVPFLMCSYHFTYGVATLVGLFTSGRRKYAHRQPTRLLVESQRAASGSQ